MAAAMPVCPEIELLKEISMSTNPGFTRCTKRSYSILVHSTNTDLGFLRFRPFLVRPGIYWVPCMGIRNLYHTDECIVSSMTWYSGHNYLVDTFKDICLLVLLFFGLVSSGLNVSAGSEPIKSIAFPFSVTNDPPKRVPRRARCVPTISIGKSSSVSGFVSCSITYRMYQRCKLYMNGRIARPRCCTG